MFVYVLHFNTKLSHAQHYVGSTANVQKRLEAHARSRGALLTAAIADSTISWELGTLFQTNHAMSREVEQILKRQHNSPRYCDICSKDMIPSLINCKKYPISELKFPTKSWEIAPDIAPIAPCVISAAQACDIPFIVNAMKKYKNELGFLPFKALEAAVQERNCILAFRENIPVGYAIFTKSHHRDSTKIHQLYTVDEERYTRVGMQLVETIRVMNSYSELEAKVRTDLSANEFWKKQGFHKTRTKRQRSLINVYHSPPLLLLGKTK